MLKLRKEDVQMLRVKSRATSQVTFDADYNVPDVKPDIARMIQNKGEVSMDEVRLNDGHAFLKGSLNVDLLYVGGRRGKSIQFIGKIAGRGNFEPGRDRKRGQNVPEVGDRGFKRSYDPLPETEYKSYCHFSCSSG